MQIKPKQQIKKIPKLRFPEFGGEWEEKRLGEIAKFRRGSFPQPYGLSKWYDDENGLPFIQVYDVGFDGRLKETTKRKITPEAAKLSVFAEKGTVVLTIQGSIGRIAITQYDAYIDRTLLIFTSYLLPVNKEFFMYSVYLLFEEEKRKAPGGTIKTITKEKLTNFKIYLPPLPEQEKIASFLSVVDEWVENLKGQKVDLEKYKKGVMQKLFPAKGEQVPQLRFSGFTGNWEEKKLGEVFELKKGSGLSKEKLSVNGKYKCILYGEIYTTYNEYIKNIKSKTDVEEGVKSKKGDILIPASTTTSHLDLATSTTVLEDGVLLGGDINILRAKQEISSIFMSLYLTHAKKFDLAKLAQGTTIIHLYGNHFKNLKIKFPPLPEQEKIASFLTALDDIIEKTEQKISQAEQWKKGLMQRLFV